MLLRSLVGLETGGGTEFFGEPQLDVADLLRVAPDGRGVISCVELAAVQDKPELWSTALMWLVAELFEALPEAGDLPKPKLVVFLDEAHLLFADATDAFLDVARAHRAADPLQGRRRLLRHPAADRPLRRGARAARPARPARAAGVHAGRREDAARDRLDLPALGLLRRRDAADVGRDGEAAVTLLSEKGVPTPVVHTRLLAPASRMEPADDVAGAAKASPLWAKYGARIDAQSAREILAGRLAAPAAPAADTELARADGARARPAPPEPRRARAPAPGGGADAIGDFLRSREGKALQRKVTRGLFGMLRKRL